ncbi:ATP-binding cassette domain-containing protein [Corynebacterium sp.]|uniref:ATP-binding cassette domain-containing protein n=1 Tax=Corynebacterium sp. TaxID=1720 RepID=UPI0028AA8DC2|nr:ATP-binding cassette domain-containing protein [Corynebacterium sp.]
MNSSPAHTTASGTTTSGTAMASQLKAVTHKVPVLFVAIGIIAIAYIAFPVIALALRVPWGDFSEIATAPETIELLKTTLSAATLSTVIATVLGIGLALWLSQLRRGASAVRLLVYLPLAMPPVVSGLALTAFVGRRGLLAPVLDFFGWQLAFAFPGVVAAHVFVTIPFVVVAVDSALRQIDSEITASARGVGIGQWMILGRITLPTIAPVIVTGLGLAFARSLGEFGTTITFAGSMPGVTRTLPLGIYLEREVSAENAYALSAILIGIAVLSLIVAGLPMLFSRQATQKAQVLGSMDVEKLRELTRPDVTGPDIKVTSNGQTTHFPSGETTTVIGMNGSGKTTLMSLIAGRLTSANFTLHDNPKVVLLTQNPGLPKNASVNQAITMVTRSSARTAELLAAAGLSALSDVRIPTLSGGQAAQVALVRALAARPQALILDEPLAAIDVSSAARWRRFLHATATDRTTLLVTHNALDVAGLSHNIAVMEAGRVMAFGPTNEILSVPPTAFVADIAGLNRLTGTIQSIDADGQTVINSHNQDIHGVLEIRPSAPESVPSEMSPSTGANATVVFSPYDVQLHLEPLGKTPGATTIRGTVHSVTADTLSQLRVSVRVGNELITVPVDASHAFNASINSVDEVDCTIDISKVRVYQH